MLDNLNSSAFVNISHDNFNFETVHFEERVDHANRPLMTAFQFAITPVYTPEQDQATNAGPNAANDLIRAMSGQAVDCRY